ncbi:MAG: chromosome segregation protein SMC [Candidatus Kapabacteria bacterium]|nr:chromosome segregation protein SMC [Candidatus Kapabacteria bacterium]
MEYVRPAVVFMFVSRLELFGFKSFAQRTTLLFPEGLTAIVGPNGCGKSNLVDAFRWVVGEQRLSVLRCESLEQLIFSGSRSCKPLGMAEVTLTVENVAGVLPVEFTHVVVTRRIYRNGESQFQLNGTPCRLRDIQELFLDTGFAAHSYSVIELRMVEELLSGRPEERRRLIEEAAGIGKYKARQREAQRKLEQVQRDIEQMEALLVELRRQATALREQAEQARQWHYWHEERQRAEILIAALQWRRLMGQLQEAESSAEDYRQGLDSIRQRIEQVRGQLQTEEQRHAELRESVRQLNEQQQELHEQLQSLRVQDAALQERLRITIDSRERLLQERQRLRQELEHLEREQESALQRMQEVQSRCEELQQHYHSAYQNMEVVRQALQQWHSSSHPQRQRVEEQRRSLFQLRVEHERLQARREFLMRQIQQAQSELQQLQCRRAELEDVLHREEEALRHLDAESIQLRAQLQRLERHEQELSERLQRLHQQREHRFQEVLALRARHDWLISIVGEHSLLRAFQAALSETECTVVAEHVVVPEALRKAFVAAVAPLLDIPLLPQRDSWSSDLETLRAALPSGAVLNLRPDEPEPLPPVRGHQGVIGWLWELVALRPELAAALQRAIGRVLVVESLSIGEQLFGSDTVDAIVTVEGVFVHRCGLVRWSDGVAYVPWLGRRQVLEELSCRLEALQEDLRRLEAEEEDIRHRLQQDSPVPLRTALAETELQMQRLQLRIEQLQQQLEGFFATEQQLQQYLQQCTTECTQRADAFQRLTQQLREAQELLIAAEEELATSYSEEGRLRTELEAALQQWRHTEQQLLSAQRQRDYLQQTSRELTQRVEQLRRREHQTGQEEAELEALYQRLSHDIEQATRNLREMGLRLEQLRQRHRVSSQQEQQTYQRCTELRSQLAALQSEEESYARRVHDVELRQEQLRAQVQSLTERFRRDFGVDPAAVELPNPVPSVAALQQRVRTAMAQLEGLGPVNFRALQEYEEVNERLQFLEAQYADLQQAARSLCQILEETYRIALQRFEQTFEQVRQNFQRLFRLLFDGADEADLYLDEGEPLEAPIMIIAKPHGKRPQLLEQLSSGEKTLVAIALLFAIYLVKPSPFCVLDEVDAPLDDSNIDRFLRLLRSFADGTQFLLITHNKRTMAAMDTLYGVTMQPEGVSKVFSIRLRPTEVAS